MPGNGTNLSAQTATLVWQDAEELVSDIGFADDDHHFLKFTVNEATIQQGNAVVAVKDEEGQIMWSWHIWVTEHNLEETPRVVSDSDGTTYSFFPVNLGWCATSNTLYEARSVKVRFTQTQTDQSQVITINQNEYEVPLYGNYAYYQWGRKDPMIPSLGTGFSEKIWYDADNVSHQAIVVEQWETDRSVVVKGILNPGTFCANVYMDNTYYNLWTVSTYSSNVSSEKSIYDPCPVGYKVPVRNAFVAVTGNTGNLIASPRGYFFPCTVGENESTIYFP